MKRIVWIQGWMDLKTGEINLDLCAYHKKEDKEIFQKVLKEIKETWKKAFQKSWHLFSNAFLLTVLCILLINIGFILFIAPGVFALFLLSLVYPITAIKKSKPIKTIQQSCHLNITH